MRWLFETYVKDITQYFGFRRDIVLWILCFGYSLVRKRRGVLPDPRHRGDRNSSLICNSANLGAVKAKNTIYFDGIGGRRDGFGGRGS
jgi:hypothetical protein